MSRSGSDNEHEDSAAPPSLRDESKHQEESQNLVKLNEELSVALAMRVAELDDLKLKISEYAGSRLHAIKLEQDNEDLKKQLQSAKEKAKRSQSKAQQLMSSEVTLKMKLVQQAARHEQENAHMEDKMKQMEEEVKKTQEVLKAQLELSDDEKISSLAEELSRLRDELSVKEEKWSEQFRNLKLQARTETDNIKEAYDNEKANYKSEMEAIKERWKVDGENQSSVIDELRETIAKLRRTNIDLETSKKETENSSEFETVNNDPEMGGSNFDKIQPNSNIEFNALKLRIRKLEESCDEYKSTIKNMRSLKSGEKLIPVSQPEVKTAEADDEEFKFSVEPAKVVHLESVEPVHNASGKTNGMSQLQVIDAANTIEHHRKESMMLWVQVQASEENLVNVDSLKRQVALMQNENRELKEKIHGESILVSAIEKMKDHRDKLQAMNEELKQKEQSKALSYANVVKNLAEKTKEKHYTEKRNQELEEQLRDYNKLQAAPSVPEILLQLEHSTSAHNIAPPEASELIEPVVKTEKEPNSTKETDDSKSFVDYTSLVTIEQQKDVIRKLELEVSQLQSSTDMIEELKSVMKDLRSKGTDFDPSDLIKTQKGIIQELECKVGELQTSSEAIEEQKGQIKDLQSKLAEFVTSTNISKELTLIVEELKSKQTSSDLIEKQRSVIQELQSSQMETLIDLQKRLQEKEDSITTKNLNIEKLETDLELKDSRMRTQEKQMREEIEKLENKSRDLEQRLIQSRTDSENADALRRRTAQLSSELTLAITSKMEVVCILAQEIERLRNREGSFVTVKKNIFRARHERMSGPEYSSDSGIELTM